MSDILTAEQLAQSIGLSVKHVHTLTRTGAIPYYLIGGAKRYRLEDILSATRINRHPDDEAVMRFTDAMRDKMRESREKGRAGWEQCNPDVLRKLLRVAVEKGDPVDVGDFAMMLFAMGERTV